jgi:hypothetical protein
MNASSLRLGLTLPAAEVGVRAVCISGPGDALAGCNTAARAAKSADGITRRSPGLCQRPMGHGHPEAGRRCLPDPPKRNNGR